MFTGRLPEPSAPHPYGDKLHQQFQRSRGALEHILAGYCLPDPYYREKMNENRRVPDEGSEGPHAASSRATGQYLCHAVTLLGDHRSQVDFTEKIVERVKLPGVRQKYG